MSDKHKNEALRKASGVFCASLLDSILPAIREVARENGYAVAVHGSLKRDIDLVAVPWTDCATPVDELAKDIRGAVRSVLGRCHFLGDPKQKPHGRVAYMLVHMGHAGEIDLSIFPPQGIKDAT